MYILILPQIILIFDIDLVGLQISRAGGYSHGKYLLIIDDRCDQLSTKSFVEMYNILYMLRSTITSIGQIFFVNINIIFTDK